MRKKILFLLLLFSMFVFSESETYTKVYLEQQAKKIVKEAEYIYKLERAAWLGSDLFFEKFREKANKMGGYITYIENNKNKVIFYSKDEQPKVIASFIFDNSFDLKKVKIDSNERTMTKYENELRMLRKNITLEISKGTFYTYYSNTGVNIIPLIRNGQKEAYILTAPKLSNTIIFGNDYKITFNDDYTIKETEKFHLDIIPMELLKEKNKQVTGGAHTHTKNSSEFITPTDLCTLMLYAKMYNLENYYVLSEKYVSIWDVNKNKLVILSKEEWENQNKNSMIIIE